MSSFRRTAQTSEDLDRVKSEIGRLDETMQRHDERAKQFEDALAGQPDSATAAATAVSTPSPSSSPPSRAG